MSRWDLLCLCVYISNTSSVPLEELWWDNQLTLIGAFSVIALEVGIINKVLKYSKK